MLEAIDKQARAQFTDESKRRPDGVIVIPRTEVSNFTYEPFLSPMGSPLGMRLKYDMRFSAIWQLCPFLPRLSDLHGR